MTRGWLNPWMWNRGYRGPTKLYKGFLLLGGWAPTRPVLFKGQPYCEMISTVSMVNIHHLTQIQLKKEVCPCDENSWDLLS